MTSRALVTGSEGFVGRVLCAKLEASGWTVLGCDRAVPEGAENRRVCDVSDADEVAETLEWAGPLSHVFHLAAVTFVPDAVANPAAGMNVNICGTIHVATALRRRTRDARLIFIGSSEVYGPPQSIPVREDHPFNPNNPYAISKAAADQYCAFLHASTGADIVRVRPFNHSGPGQSPQFVLSSFAQQLARIEAELEPPVIKVGNLDARRDFSHVDDVVAAYEALARDGKSGEAYNVCSNEARSIREALDTLLAMARVDVRVETDPERMRPIDVPEVRGAHGKLTSHTGWQPEKSFESLLAELLDYWRSRVREESLEAQRA